MTARSRDGEVRVGEDVPWREKGYGWVMISARLHHRLAKCPHDVQMDMKVESAARRAPRARGDHRPALARM